MQHYYRLRNPVRVLNDLASVVTNDSQLYHWDEIDLDEDGTFPFLFGRPLNLEVPVRGKVIGEGPIPEFHEGTCGIFARGALAESCERLLAPALQRFPVENSRCNDLFVLNVTYKFDAIDFGLSEVVADEMIPSICTVIRKLQLRPDVVDPAVPIFRLRGANHLAVVSAQGRDALLEAGVADDFFDASLFAS